jgi:hypothetical protein
MHDTNHKQNYPYTCIKPHFAEIATSKHIERPTRGNHSPALPAVGEHPVMIFCAFGGDTRCPFLALIMFVNAGNVIKVLICTFMDPFCGDPFLPDHWRKASVHGHLPPQYLQGACESMYTYEDAMDTHLASDGLYRAELCICMCKYLCMDNHRMFMKAHKYGKGKKYTYFNRKFSA